ncbi:alkaline phosphatase PhoX [Pontibacter sp. JAM-7]|uniref:alkaline phosphatase PhoX n=1 Tax=Pontibacter sp. JAM-7 TaxID=3366581 RepID=UPI003AF5DAC1
MKPMNFAVSLLAFAVAQAATAGTEPYFTPLTSSALVGEANDQGEMQAPFVAPEGLQFKNLNSLHEVETYLNQSVQRVPGLGTGASMFDMLAYSEDGKQIFIPHETSIGAGVSRYDIENDVTELLFAGDQRGAEGDWSFDFGAFDPARLSPNGTLWLAEEWSGTGRVVEILDPLAAAPLNPQADMRGNWRVLTSIPRVSHEGIGFSKMDDNKTIYFVDEDRSGSIYKIVLNTAGDYVAGGQVFVLAVDAFDGDAAQRWDRAPNIGLTRTGHATWVAITDENGNDLPDVTNPYDNSETGSSRPGRVAADDVNATPFGRPEDVEVGTLASGNEVLYFTATSEQAVYSVEMLPGGDAMVREFASEANTAKNLGFPGTTGVLNSPDNLAQDALGNIYIIEDAPNSSSTGGDTWFVRDLDNDGVAESLDHFMSLRVRGSEATGMVFNPVKPTEFAIAVQHPASTNLDDVPGGFGDAVWQVKLKNNGLNKDFVKALKDTKK